MIRFEHVNKSFGAEKVLVDFSLHIEEGEFLTVIGRSGCGKTTMLRMINGLQIPDFRESTGGRAGCGEGRFDRFAKKDRICDPKQRAVFRT